METRKKKSFKRLFAFLMAFVMVTTLAVSAVFAADPTFKDVPKDYEFYDEIEDLAAKKIVSGYGDTGLFKPEEKLTRAQAAKMIAKAAGIKVSKGFKTSFTDVDEDVDMYEHIWALEEAEIVKGWGTTKEFRPDEAIERGHVAKMIALAFGIVDGSKKVEFKDLPADKDVAAAIMALATNDIVKGYGTTGEFKPEEPVLRGQFSKMVSRAMNLKLEIVEAKALSRKKVELTFNKVTSFKLSEVTFTNAKTGIKAQISALKPAKDKGKLNVEFVANLAAETTYNIVAKEATGQLTLGKLLPATIKADTPQLVKVGVPTDVEYEIYDEDGVQIDLPTGYDVVFTAPQVINGKVTLALGVSVKTKVKILKGAELIAESEEIELIAENAKAAELVDWTLHDSTNFTGWDATDYERVDEMEAEGTKYLNVYIEDQFGDKVTTNIGYESQDTSVAIVDNATGKITPIKEGVLPIKVEVKAGATVQLSEVVVVTLKEVKKLTTIQLDPSTVTVSKEDDTGVSTKLLLLDQFGKEYTKKDVSVTAAHAVSGLSPTTGTTYVESSVVTVKANDADKGTYKITFQAMVGTPAKLVKAELTVVVVEPGIEAKVIVRGLVPVLDKNGVDGHATKLPLSMMPYSVPVDAAGYPTGPSSVVWYQNRTLHKKNLAGIYEVVTENSNTISADTLPVGEYRVDLFTTSGKTVSLGSHYFEVVDTKPAKSLYFVGNEITLKKNVDWDETVRAKLKAILRIDGKELETSKELTSRKVYFVTADSAVIQTEDISPSDLNAISIKGTGETMIYITSIEYDGVVYEFDYEPISVKVN